VCPVCTPQVRWRFVATLAILIVFLETGSRLASGSLLTAYLKAHPGSRSQVQVRVARVTKRAATRVDIIGVAALVGATRSPSKARASRRTVVSVVVREKR
jgi:hypothetical protein